MAINITKDASGAVGYNTNGGLTIWFVNPESVIVKYDVQNVILIFLDRVYTFPIAGMTIDGTPIVGDAKEVAEVVATEVFASQSGGGSNIPTGTDRQVLGYVGGVPTPVTLGWKQFSDLPTPPTFSNGVLTGTAFASDGSALFAFVELALGAGGISLVKPNAIPFYNPGQIGTGGGTLAVANGVNTGDAVNLSQLNGRLSANQRTAINALTAATSTTADIVNALKAL